MLIISVKHIGQDILQQVTTLVEDATADPILTLPVKSPKSCASPVVAIVINVNIINFEAG